MKFQVLAPIALAMVLSSCAPSRPMTPDAAPPRAVELQEERSIATMHFAPGIYLLDGSDRSGYYYRASTGVIQHGFGTRMRREGGLFLQRNTGRVRGYVMWAGERRKIGNVSRGYELLR